MKFNIVITDTETGETLINENTNCINAAISLGDGKAQAFSISEANAIDIAATISASNNAGLECCKENPEVALVLLLGKQKEEKGGAENE